MKKIYFSLLIGLFMVLFTNKVEARSAVCVYDSEFGEKSFFSVEIVDEELKVLYIKDSSTIPVNHSLTIKDFENKDNPKILECVPKFYATFNDNPLSYKININSGEVKYNLNKSNSTISNDLEKPEDGEVDDGLGDDGLKSGVCVYGENEMFTVYVTWDSLSAKYTEIGKDKNLYNVEYGSLSLARFKKGSKSLKCPSVLYYSYGDGAYINNISLSLDSGHSYLKLNENKTQINNSGVSSNKGDSDNPYINDNFDVNVSLNIQHGCSVFSGDMKDWLIQLLDITKIVGVVLAAILSMVDFLKGVGTGSADTMKKVWQSVGNRLIAVVLLFLLPVLIEFIFGLVTIEGVDITNPLCGIK